MSSSFPVIGGLIIGLMARYGSDRIRGHGIPQAIESILISGSRVEPKLAILKPLSSAISIGSGGPFGAEGPIIMTAAHCGSLIAQFLHLTSCERKTLLVAGAAARAVVHRMASTGLTRFPVVERGLERRLVGMISLRDLLAGRTRTAETKTAST